MLINSSSIADPGRNTTSGPFFQGSQDQPLTFPDWFPESCDLSYSLVKTKDEELSNDLASQAMWLITSKERIPIREGLHFAHGIETFLPILPFCAEHVVNNLSVLPIPEKVFNRLDQPIELSELFELNGSVIRRLFVDEAYFSHLFGTCLVESYSRIKKAVPFLSQYVKDDDFQRACSYLFLSMTELGYDVCDWRDNNYDQSFYRFVTVARAESAFLNAFKVVEAILGEPSKNRTRIKLKERLSQKGINVSERVGYNNKQSLIDKILEYH